jgi:hypothetical protein
VSSLDIAATGPKKVSGPAHYSALLPAIFDVDTGRTYQLVKRDSDSCPHALSCAGNHPRILDALNSSRALTAERDGLKDDKSADANKRRDEIKSTLDALTKTALQRTDYAATMLQLYAQREAA